MRDTGAPGGELQGADGLVVVGPRWADAGQQDLHSGRLDGTEG